MSELFTPITFKSVTLKNRIAVSPMCQYSGVNGFATDWHLVHLGSRAVGGAGLVVQEATAVSPEGRITHGDLGIWNDEHITKLRTITDFIHANGSVAGIQLAHAGRKASCEKSWLGGQQLTTGEHSWQTVAASAIPFKPTDAAPHALTLVEIEDIIAQFAAAAARSLQAGYKMVEIHAAHGYLIHQFLSPLSNTRQDDYGGSFENRIRFLIQIIEAVQKVWPNNLPIFVRISATDWVEGGWDIHDSVQLSIILKKMDISLVDCSSGVAVHDAKITATPGFQVGFAAQIKAEADIPTGAVGLITTAQQAEAILQNNEADLIFMARQLLRSPYWPLQAAAELQHDVDWPPQYARAK